MTIIGVSFVRDKWSNSFPKLIIDHYDWLTFIHKVSLYSFPSEFDAQVTLLFECIPITLFSSFIVLRFKLRYFHDCLAKVLVHHFIKFMSKFSVNEILNLLHFQSPDTSYFDIVISGHLVQLRVINYQYFSGWSFLVICIKGNLWPKNKLSSNERAWKMKKKMNLTDLNVPNGSRDILSQS